MSLSILTASSQMVQAQGWQLEGFLDYSKQPDEKRMYLPWTGCTTELPGSHWWSLLWRGGEVICWLLLQPLQKGQWHLLRHPNFQRSGMLSISSASLSGNRIKTKAGCFFSFLFICFWFWFCFVNLTRAIWEEGTSNEKMPPKGQAPNKPIWHFLN